MAESQIGRVEKKLDDLTKVTNDNQAELREIRQAIAFQAKETAQVHELVKDKVGRVESDIQSEAMDRKAADLVLGAAVETEKREREKDIGALRATLGRIAMALFTALLSLIVAIGLYLATK